MANNENVNKVSYNNSVLIDLTEDTITPEVVVSGYTAHDRSGASISGTFVPVTGVKGNAESSYRTGNVNLTPANIGAIAASAKGAASGVAELDSNGKVPSSQLPSYVDDVLEYAKSSSFPATGESGKIYIAQDTNKTYRWSGTAYVEISASLALGTTSSTAYRGDYGNAAYTHAVTNKGSAFSSGLYKITTNSEGHVTGATAVTKSDITGLGIPGSDTTYTFDGTYNASTNKAATVSTVTNAIAALDGNLNNTTPGAGKTLTAFSETDGKVSATFGNISITKSQVSDLGTVGAAAAKGVDTSIAASSTSTNLPTSKAVAAFVEGKGYKTTDNNTTYSLTQDSSNGHKITLTPSSGTAQTITIPDMISYGICSTNANAQVKVVTISNNNWQLKIGSIIGVKYSNTNTYNATTSAPVKLNVNDTGEKQIYYGGSSTPTGTNMTAFGCANQYRYYMYDGTYWVFMGLSYHSDTYTSAYCSTAAATSAKTASCSDYALLAKSYLHVTITNSNTAASALTLNVNGRGAKPIYINGAASSASNHTLPAGSYIVYYDGTNYYFRTDGKLTADITGTASNITGTIAIEHGGTGATTASGARTNLGLGNVENKSSATIRGELTKANITTALGYTPPTTDTNTWRPVSDSVSSTSSSDAASSKAVKTAYDLAASKTANTGTVTSVATGVGLTGGTITGSGTLKAKLRSETALTIDSAAATTTSGRVYPIAVDKTGYLAVNVPWVSYSNATTSAAGLMSAADKTKSDSIEIATLSEVKSYLGIS